MSDSFINGNEYKLSEGSVDVKFSISNYSQTGLDNKVIYSSTITNKCQGLLLYCSEVTGSWTSDMYWLNTHYIGYGTATLINTPYSCINNTGTYQISDSKLSGTNPRFIQLWVTINSLTPEGSLSTGSLCIFAKFDYGGDRIDYRSVNFNGILKVYPIY